MKQTLLALVIFLYSPVTIPCQYTSNQSELESARKDRQEMKKLARKMAGISDRIFVASISEIGEHSFKFEDIVDLKGKTKEGEEFTWTEPEFLLVGCSGVSDFSHLNLPDNDSEMGILVYVKGGIILRLNHVGSFAQKPSGYEEIEWLKK